jgi:integrase
MNIKDIQVKLNSSYSPLKQSLLKKPLDTYYRNIASVPNMKHVLNSFYELSARDQYLLNIGAVCKLNGCRINEILSLEWCQTLPSGLAFIKASKGSNSKMIYLGLTPQDREEMFPFNPRTLIYHASYIEVYKCLVKYNCFTYEQGHLNRSVTHSGRYTLAERVRGVLGQEAASQVLGHKSKTAIDNYLGKVDLKKERERKYRARLRVLNSVCGPTIPKWLQEVLEEGV